jgi:hypothetical protein
MRVNGDNNLSDTAFNCRPDNIPVDDSPDTYLEPDRRLESIIRFDNPAKPFDKVPNPIALTADVPPEISCCPGLI